MEIVNIEENVAKTIESALALAYSLKKRKSKDYKQIYAYHACVFNISNGYEIFAHHKEYLSILSLCLTGFIKIDDEVIDYREDIAKDKDSFERSQYYLALAYLITIDYLENGNLYKAAINAFNNKNYLFLEVDKDRDFYDDFRISFPLLKLFDTKVPEVLKMIYESDNLVK